QEALAASTLDAFRLAKARYEKGIDDYLSTLDAQRSSYTAQQAAAGDEWLGVETQSKAGTDKSAKNSAQGETSANPNAWRLRKLDDLPLYAGAHTRLTALVARDQRLLRLPLVLPKTSSTWRLALEAQDKLQRWLA
ncbi:hypothetical protein P3G55_22840, partial [Leptospira sp. 96542]|nr:hypothetical protein [Leptospira sp. 96542]